MTGAAGGVGRGAGRGGRAASRSWEAVCPPPRASGGSCERVRVFCLSHHFAGLGHSSRRTPGEERQASLSPLSALPRGACVLALSAAAAAHCTGCSVTCSGGTVAGPGRGASSPLRRHREALTARGLSSGQLTGRGQRFRCLLSFPACPARRPLAAGQVARGDFHVLAWIFKRKTNHRKLARPGASSGPSRCWTSRLTRSSRCAPEPRGGYDRAPQNHMFKP